TAGDGADRTDAQLAGAARYLALVVSPHEHGAGFGVHRDVEAVLGPIVDQHVERERFSDLAARSMDDEHRGREEAVGHEPAVTLLLRRIACCLRSAREEDDLPAAL